MQKFFSDSSILNYVHSLTVIASGKGEEFDFSVSNDVDGVKISNYLDILDIISYCRSDPFTLIDLDIPTISYMIACTNTQLFEEGENCACTISVEHTLLYDMKLFGYYMILFGSDMILLGSSFQFQELSLFLVVGLINFCVKNQVPQIPFKVDVGDLMSVLYYEVADIILYVSGYFGNNIRFEERSIHPH